MKKRIEDITKEEIDTFRKDIDEIRISTKYSMPEKAEKIKERVKELFKDLPYLETFKLLKESKVAGNSRKTYGPIYEEALEDLLQKKKKELSYNELDEVLDHFQDETNRTRSFIKETEKSLRSTEEIQEKSKKLTEEDLNYKRLAVAASEGTLTDDQKIVFENEGNKTLIKKEEEKMKVIEKYQEDISREISKKTPEDPKKL